MIWRSNQVDLRISPMNHFLVRTHERITYFDKMLKREGQGKRRGSRSCGTGHAATPADKR
jgi:hypothetical protein